MRNFTSARCSNLGIQWSLSLIEKVYTHICRTLGITPRPMEVRCPRARNRWHRLWLLSDFRDRNGVERASTGQQQHGLREIHEQVNTMAFVLSLCKGWHFGFVFGKFPSANLGPEASCAIVLRGFPQARKILRYYFNVGHGRCLLRPFTIRYSQYTTCQSLMYSLSYGQCR